MAVIFDTPVFRPDTGVHHVYAPAKASCARGRAARYYASVRPAAARNRLRPLAAHWTVGDDGRLACSWAHVSQA